MTSQNSIPQKCENKNKALLNNTYVVTIYNAWCTAVISSKYTGFRVSMYYAKALVLRENNGAWNIYSCALCIIYHRRSMKASNPIVYESDLN
jgi:hypothetical protein